MKGIMIWALAAALLSLPSIAEAQRPTEIGPHRRSHQKGAVAPDGYIITLRDGADPASVAAEVGVKPKHVYRHLLKGFRTDLKRAERERLQRDSRVVRIEPDALVSAYQSASSWGLDRIDQRALPLSSTFTRWYTGRGVTVYIVDTGIRYDHTEFGGRAIPGYDAFGGDGNDCNGHGTHVAGVAGGSTYGVANEVTLVSARVLDCYGSGYTSGVIAALDWIAANRRLPAVVNMSLGGPIVQALDDAVARLQATGVIVAAAAGNDSTDACLGSPARVAEVLTVGASDQYDRRGSFSSYGSCVDLFAPGVLVPGPYARSSTDLVLMSGTSTATPHVAGTVALLLQHYPSLTARQVHDSIRAFATKSVVSDALSANNHLLYALEGVHGTVATEPAPAPAPSPDPTPLPNQPPAASFTVSCTNYTCTFSDRSTDSDGRVVAWSWAFGTGATSTQQNPTYSFPAAGTYTVTLRVTDDKGATGTSAGSFTLSPPPPAAIGISLRGSRSSNTLTVDISWSGATGSYVDIYRNGVRIASTPNDGHYRDALRVKGGGTVSYRVCLSGSTTCSGTATMNY